MPDEILKQEWPRASRLPEQERPGFERWLNGQTRPWIDGVADDQQDGYFPWDYERWKSGQRTLVD